MTRRLISARIGGIRLDGRQVWLTVDDRWTLVPSEAELIEDEAHGDIRLLDAELSNPGLRDIRLVATAETDAIAS